MTPEYAELCERLSKKLRAARAIWMLRVDPADLSAVIAAITALSEENERLTTALASAESRATSSCCVEDGAEPCGPFMEAIAERDTALARATEAEKALREIAQQRLHAEITDSDPDELDWLGGYEECVRSARSVLSRIAKEEKP